MLVIQGNPVGLTVFQSMALWVTGKENGIVPSTSRGGPDGFGQAGRLTGQVDSSGESSRIHDQEEDIVARDPPTGFVTAGAPGEAPGPEIQNEAQAETFVGLGSAEGQNRPQWRLVQNRRIGRRFTAVVQEPTFRHGTFTDVIPSDLPLGNDTGPEVHDDRRVLDPWSARPRRRGWY